LEWRINASDPQTDGVQLTQPTILTIVASCVWEIRNSLNPSLTLFRLAVSAIEPDYASS
jgi:hypothetical protein